MPLAVTRPGSRRAAAHRRPGRRRQADSTWLPGCKYLSVTAAVGNLNFKFHSSAGSDSESEPRHESGLPPVPGGGAAGQRPPSWPPRSLTGTVEVVAVPPLRAAKFKLLINWLRKQVPRQRRRFAGQSDGPESARNQAHSRSHEGHSCRPFIFDTLDLALPCKSILPCQILFKRSY